MPQRLVLLHGWGATAADLKPLGEQLAAQHPEPAGCCLPRSTRTTPTTRRTPVVRTLSVGLGSRPQRRSTAHDTLTRALKRWNPP